MISKALVSVFFFCVVFASAKPSLEEPQLNEKNKLFQDDAELNDILQDGERSNVKRYFGPCGEGIWTFHNGFCYHVSSKSVSWHAAQAACVAKKANLVKITSADENDFVLYLFNKFAPQRRLMWMGLRYWRNDRKFHWTDGSLPEYKNFAPTEPNGRGHEQCSNMWTNLHERRHRLRLAGTWNDLRCGKLTGQYATGYICEKIE